VIKLSTVLPHLMHQFQNERDLVKAIEEVSLKFTQERVNISDYLHDSRLNSAYAAFYFTTNFPKFKAVMEWMPQQWKEHLKASCFIDVGAGPGTFSLAYRAWMGQPVFIQQVETSPLMREQAKKLWLGFYPHEELLQSLSPSLSGQVPKTLFFGHSANEMDLDVVLSYVDQFKPDHVLFIEPGTKDFFSKMLQIRHRLLDQSYQIIFPCPGAVDCPLAGIDKDWCHQYIQLRHEAEVERLSQLARKDRRHLPVIVHAYSKIETKDVSQQRVVRVFAETKFSFEWEVCDANSIKRFQIMKRGLSKNQLERLGHVLSGAAVDCVIEKKMDHAFRVKVLKINNLPF
jgi:ribosomal protein RSM22 (predicted rRNA methylase)